jgi:hypothetical protein
VTVSLRATANGRMAGKARLLVSAKDDTGNASTRALIVKR